MLLSDRDIKSQVESGRVKLDPYSPELIQPASIDVRLDRFFRVFENHRYPHIDPAIEQSLVLGAETLDLFLEGRRVALTGEGVDALIVEGLLPVADEVLADAEGASSLGDGVALLGDELDGLDLELRGVGASRSWH